MISAQLSKAKENDIQAGRGTSSSGAGLDSVQADRSGSIPWLIKKRRDEAGLVCIPFKWVSRTPPQLEPKISPTSLIARSPAPWRIGPNSTGLGERAPVLKHLRFRAAGCGGRSGRAATAAGGGGRASAIRLCRRPLNAYPRGSRWKPFPHPEGCARTRRLRRPKTPHVQGSFVGITVVPHTKGLFGHRGCARV